LTKFGNLIYLVQSLFWCINQMPPESYSNASIDS